MAGAGFSLATVRHRWLGEFGLCRHGNQELGSDRVNGWVLVENLVALITKRGHYAAFKGNSLFVAL